MRPKTAVVIPAYQCAGQVGAVVREVQEELAGSGIIVVDDGSGDGTAEAARNAGAVVLSHPRNRGKGAALRTGFAEALRRGYQVVVTVDGDGQHRGQDAAVLAAVVAEGQADLALGNRMGNPERMPWDRRWSNRLSSLLVSIACLRRIPDSQCGVRAISAELLRSLPLASDRFEIETEVILAAAKSGARIASLPVASVYPDGEQSPPSHVARVRDTLRFLRFLLMFLLRWG
jgi:glycosyltransferase involved in cell wall biosynthesis